MWKWTLIMVLTVAMSACQGRAANGNQPAAETVVNQAVDTDAVAKRVQEIYQAVFKEYNLEDSLRNLDMLEGLGAYEHRSEFNRNYCSLEWNDLVRRINEIDSLYHSDELGFWDADYWIMGQDWHNLSISDVQVLSASADKASVAFQLHNFDSAKPVSLMLVNEDGVWKIDDFIDAENDVDWKRSMQEYVAEETARIKQK